MRVTSLVAREHLRPDVILPSVTGQSEFRGNKSEHALKKTASTIMAVATGDKCAASNQTQKKVALAMALTITKFLSSHVVVFCAADHPYFCRRFGYCFSGFFCPVELERNKNAINCPELSRHAALRARLLVGFAGAFRRSELAALEVEQVEFDSDGRGISLDFSKADQEGKGETVTIPFGSNHALVRCAPSRNGWRIRAWAWTVDPVSSRRPPWASLGRRLARELAWSHREARLSNRGLQRERICGAQSASRTGNPSRRERRPRAADHAANAASLGDDVAPLHPARFPVSGERCRQNRTIKVFAPSG